jgi:hypothetical protein
MGDVVNLNRFRKAREAAARAREAAENRVRHGRTGFEKARDAAEASRGTRAQDGARLDRTEKEPA